MPKEKMDIAIVGLGKMGLTELAELKDYELVGKILGVDPDRDKRERAKIEHGIDVYKDLSDILNFKNIRAVFIASPNHTHCKLVYDALTHGFAVMCEKPMATTLKDAQEMVDVAKATNGFLQIGLECRYSKLYAKAQSWIQQGLVGEVVNTHCLYVCSEFHRRNNWRNKRVTGGGMFGEKLSHYLDLARWFTNSSICEVLAVCAPNIIPYKEVHDNYHATYKFQNGAVGHLTFAMGPAGTVGGDSLQQASNLCRECEQGHNLTFLIVGTKGCIETNVFRHSIKRWEYKDKPDGIETVLVDSLIWPESELLQWVHSTRNQNVDIINRVLNNRPPRIVPEDAFETMEACCAIEESADGGGKPVTLR
jgi:predicted dehydrogenase